MSRFPGFRVYPVEQWSPDSRSLLLYDRTRSLAGQVIFTSDAPHLEMTLTARGATGVTYCAAE